MWKKYAETCLKTGKRGQEDQEEKVKKEIDVEKPLSEMPFDV